MAERTVNVNINYKVNTVDVEKAAQSVTKADQATQKLNQSTKDYSRTAVSTNKSTATSIEGVTVQMQRLRQQILLTNQADKKRLTELTAQYRAAKKQVEDFNKSLDGQSKATQSLAGQFSGLYNTVKLIFTAGIVKEVVDLTLGMARLSGNVEGVDRAFRHAFPNAELLLADLRKATHGTITDFELMQRTLLAKNLGVEVEHLGVIMEFVATRAQQTGQNLDVLLDKFIRGIGVKSPRLLDDLGISSIRLQENLDGVALSAISIGDFTKQVAGIAKEELGKMGGYAETAATKVDQIGVSFQQTKVDIASAFDTSIVTTWLKEITDAAGFFARAFKEGNSPAAQLLKEQIKLQALQGAQAEIDEANSEKFKDNQQAKIDFIQQEINSRVQLIGRYNDEIEKIKQVAQQSKGFGFPGFSKENIEGAKRFNELVEQHGNKARDIFLQEAENAGKSLTARQNNKTVIEETIKLLAVYLTSIKAVNEEEVIQVGLIEEVEAKISELNEKIRTSRNRSEIAAWNKEVEILKGRLSDLNKLGLPEFKSPEIFEKVSKVLDEEVKANAEKVTQEFIKIEGVIARIDNQLRSLPKDTIPVPEFTGTSFGDQLLTEIDNAKNVLANVGFDIFQEQIQSTLDLQIESMSVQLDELRNFYDEQQLLAGDNERAKDQLRLEEERKTRDLQIRIAKREKEARKFSIILDTATGIMRAFATMPTPAAIIQSAIIAALGASQLAIANRTPIPRFKEGEVNIQGPGTTTSDSIHARISKGESVINADSTRKSLGLLEMINAKKINDSVLKDLKVTPTGVKVVQMDPKPIIEAIEKNRMPDLVEQNGILWRVRKKGDNYKHYVRSKSMSK